MRPNANSDLNVQGLSELKGREFLEFRSGLAPESPTILQRVASGDKTAIKDCVDVYGGKIWAAAKRITGSSKDAENLTRKIFLDIWRYAECFNSTEFDEPVFIAFIVKGRVKALFKSKNKDDSFEREKA
jgi:RNA polymerase sigma-70 factor (ECF subfamily)